MKNISYLLLMSIALLTACGEKNNTTETEEKIETSAEQKKDEIKDAVNDTRNSLKKASYDFSNNTKEELGKMLAESNKLMDETKAGLDAAEKKVNETVGDAKVEAEKVRDQFNKRIELLSGRLEAIKAAHSEKAE